MKRSALKRTPFKRKKAKKKPKSNLQKRKDNPSSRYWKLRADAEWRGWVLERDGIACVICGRKDGLEVHHLISRARVHLRHEIINGLTLCHLHHKRDKYLSAHEAGPAFSDWMDEHRPEQAAWVRQNKHKLNHTGHPDYRAICEALGG